MMKSFETEYHKAVISKAEIGDVLSFGYYEQDNDSSNGKEPIEWNADQTVMVNEDYISYDGRAVEDELCVRPALWIRY